MSLTLGVSAQPHFPNPQVFATIADPQIHVGDRSKLLLRITNLNNPIYLNAEYVSVKWKNDNPSVAKVGPQTEFEIKIYLSDIPTNGVYETSVDIEGLKPGNYTERFSVTPRYAETPDENQLIKVTPECVIYTRWLRKTPIRIVKSISHYPDAKEGHLELKAETCLATPMKTGSIGDSFFRFHAIPT